MKQQQKIEQNKLKKYQERVGKDDKSNAYLVDESWNGQLACKDLNCGNKYMNYYLSSRNIWKCSKCKKQISLKNEPVINSINFSI